MKNEYEAHRVEFRRLQSEELQNLTDDELLAHENACRRANVKIEETEQKIRNLEEVIEENENLKECYELQFENYKLKDLKKIGDEKITALDLALEEKMKRLDQLELEELEERNLLLEYEIKDNEKKIGDLKLEGDTLQAKYDLLCSEL